MTTKLARILIVDDHPDAAESLAIVLGAEGFEVQTAQDGEAAWTKIADWRPRAALLDLHLPVVDGFEVARRVRATPWGRGILLAAVTGYGRATDRDASLAAGFDVHLTKPVEPARLLEWLGTLASETSD